MLVLTSVMKNKIASTLQMFLSVDDLFYNSAKLNT